jgi:valyl-tRNA synthetase
VRETGYDILFFWVAREIMLGLAMTGDPLCHVVYLHGLMRNRPGQEGLQVHGGRRQSTTR